MTATVEFIAPPDDEFAVRCDNLVHVYGVPGSEVAALRGVDLQVRRGEMMALLGPSGSGKSTLLWHLAGLLRPTVGTVDVQGHRLSGMSGAELARFRLREVGVVLQNAGRNLLPYLSALDNVLAVQRPARGNRSGQRRHAHGLLDAMGIGGRARSTAGRMSGGEKQRLAIAVALANEPALLLADEPTSQLDAAAATDAMGLIRTANAEFGTTVVVVTHDAEVGAALGRTVTIRDGLIGSAGFGGEDYLVVGRDGGVQLPADLHHVLPPGSLVAAEHVPDGVLLRRVHHDGEARDVRPGVGLDEPERQTGRHARRDEV